MPTLTFLPNFTFTKTMTSSSSFSSLSWRLTIKAKTKNTKSFGRNLELFARWSRVQGKTSYLKNSTDFEMLILILHSGWKSLKISHLRAKRATFIDNWTLIPQKSRSSKMKTYLILGELGFDYKNDVFHPPFCCVISNVL